VAETDGSLVIGIELSDGTIKKVQADASKLAEALGGKFSKDVGKSLDSSFTGIAVQLQFIGGIASKAFGAIKGVATQAIHEAAGAEAALSAFNQVLGNAGAFTQAASDDFAAFASSLQAVGTVSDDAVIEAAGALVSIGGLTGQALKDATQSSVDLAAGLGVDLSTAFDLTAKAASGQISALSRYGIKVDESIPKSEQFAAALAQINAKFGGLDASKANTFAGATDQFTNKVADFNQALGELITKSPAVTAVIKQVGIIIGRLADYLTAVAKTDLFNNLVKDALSLGNTIAHIVLPPLEIFYNAGVVIFNVFRTGLQEMLALLSTVAEGFAGIGNAVGLVSDESLASITLFRETAEEQLVAFAETTAQSVSDVFETTKSDFILPIIDEVTNAGLTANPLGQVVTNTQTALTDVAKVASEQGKKITGIINNGMVRGVSQGVQLMVNNIAKGKNAFSGLLGAIGNIMGDMAIQIGETLLLTGFGIEAVRDSIAGLAGGQAIAAGIALIAFGSLLKALTGGGSTGGTAPAGAAGNAGSPAQQTDLATQGDPAAVARNQQTQVNLTVQGNVLDRRETGLEIASVLQDYFDTNDGVVAKA